MSNRLDATLQRLKERGRKALITYIMAGDPSLTETEELVLELERSGADVIELGVPFSDPIADGPVIQQAAERALREGTSLRSILAAVHRLRTKTEIPIVLMAYYNTIHAFGVSAFSTAATAAGVDGLIVPDMPPEEAEPLARPARAAGLNVIYLLAPTSTVSRRKIVAKQSTGFIYYVSLTGITGAKLCDLQDVEANVAKIRRESATPVAVGFGVATPDDAASVAAIADGVIVGSAIVRRIGEHAGKGSATPQVGAFVRSLKAALQAV